MPTSNLPLRFDLQVSADGRVEIQAPALAGQPVTILVVPQGDDLEELRAAASSSTDFWDNPYDDEDWNGA